MLIKTIHKIKEYSEAIAVIARSFAMTIASIFASIAAGITGYREVKKLIKAKPETLNVESVRTTTGISSTGGPTSSSTTTSTTTTTSSPQLPYTVDYNTLFFGIAAVFLLGTFIAGKIKKKDKK